MSQFRLTRSLRSEEIQDREGACCARHNVTEERSQQEQESHPAIVAKHTEDLIRKLPQCNVRLSQMHKQPFKLEEFAVIAVDFRVGRQVEIPNPLDAYDAVVIDLQEFPLVEYAIAKGKESLPLPSQLHNHHSRFGLLIEKALQLSQFSLRSLPDIVA